jgi:hypothetical protein
VQERPNSHTISHSRQTPALARVLGKERAECRREIRSSPGAPRELDHAGGVEGTSAPVRRRGAAGKEEREHRREEEVAAEIHGAAKWEGDLRCGTTTGEEEAVCVELTVQAPRRCQTATDSGPGKTWSPSEESRTAEAM